MCGREDELVARLLVPLAGIVLHQLADEATLRVEHGEPGADLRREGEQVQLGAELAMVPALGLLETVEVLRERLRRLPGGAVDALQLRPVLVAAPVGAGDAHQLEVAEPARLGHVRAPAQVDEVAGVPIGGDEPGLVAADLRPELGELGRPLRAARPRRRHRGVAAGSSTVPR